MAVFLKKPAILFAKVFKVGIYTNVTFFVVADPVVVLTRSGMGGGGEWVMDNDHDDGNSSNGNDNGPSE
jgi:hypothetical protein